MISITDTIPDFCTNDMHLIFLIILNFFLSSLSEKVPVSMAGECKSFSSNYPCLAEERRSSVVERRREGRYKTFDWAEFSHIRKKREMLSMQPGTESAFVCEDDVPLAPAPSPEEPVAGAISVPHTTIAQEPQFTKPTDFSPLIVRSSIIAGKLADQKSAEVYSMDVINNVSNAHMEEKKKVPTS